MHVFDKGRTDRQIWKNIVSLHLLNDTLEHFRLKNIFKNKTINKYITEALYTGVYINFVWDLLGIIYIYFVLFGSETL